MEKIFELIRGRKSVRTFDGNPLSSEHLEALKEYANGITNPFGIHVEFVFLDAKENGLSSPVLSGENLYVTGKVEKKPYSDVAFGYSFEDLVLYAWSLGIGTVFIGGTMKRENFEKAAGLKENELMPCISPLGYPAKKKSVKEIMMRKGVGADSRMSSEKLFFENEWENPLSVSDDMKDVFEAVRWAPSAVNKQPWRIILKDGIYHFYEKSDIGYKSDAVGDMQKIDIGIALYHFTAALKEKGKTCEIEIKDPGLVTPGNVEYIASVKF